MLAIIAVVAVLWGLGFLCVAVAALLAMKRLRLQFWAVVIWLGLADDPVDELAGQRTAPRLRVVHG